MKSSYLLASLALGSTTLARLIPRAELDSRQWTCRWTGHCLGDECETNRDCDGDLVCRNYECANPGGPVKPTTTRKTSTTIKTTAHPTNTVPPGCVWPGHCLVRYHPSSCAAYYDDDSNCASSDYHHYSAYPSPDHHHYEDYEYTDHGTGAYYYEQAAHEPGKS
ncbi:hypothetical protein N0V85_009138 [Neurospora sp. IMI 360204]|nr:hypothetical protein N0V85_009138 [Neurospora sp. IMI 360204]